MNHKDCDYCSSFRFKDSCKSNASTCEMLPSPQETHKWIQRLFLKCNQLEKEIGELRVSNTRVKKKVEISILPKQSWKEWMHKKIEPHHLHHVYKEDLVEAIKYYISDLIRKTEPNELPVYSKETQVLFVYSESGWKKVNSNEFEKAINEIAHRFLQEFTKMQHENIDKICSNNEEREKNIIFMMKINATTTEKTSNNIKKWLISKVKFQT